MTRVISNMARAVFPVSLVVCSGSAFAQHGIAGNFSATTNPNGVWTSGRPTGVDGTFTNYANAYTATAGGTINVWNDHSHISD